MEHMKTEQTSKLQLNINPQHYEEYMIIYICLELKTCGFIGRLV